MSDVREPISLHQAVECESNLKLSGVQAEAFTFASAAARECFLEMMNTEVGRVSLGTT